MLEVIKVKAVLIQNISYNKEGAEIQHRSGTTIEVDPENGIAFLEGDHFDVDKSEYKVMFLN